MLLVDYHLAALRFILGMSPSDDYFHRPLLVQSIWHSSASAETLRFCLRRLQAALDRAYERGRLLDHLNETSWHEAEINIRVERRYAILNDLSVKCYITESQMPSQFPMDKIQIAARKDVIINNSLKVIHRPG